MAQLSTLSRLATSVTEALYRGIVAGERLALSKAITLGASPRRLTTLTVDR